MRTSLTEIAQIEACVQRTAAPGDALLFEAKLILDPELHQKVQWHKQTLSLVHQYGRANLKAIIGEVHQQLFTVPKHQTFREKILRLFH